VKSVYTFYADLCDPEGLARKSVYVNGAILGARAHWYAPLFVSDEFPTIVFVCPVSISVIEWWYSGSDYVCTCLPLKRPH